MNDEQERSSRDQPKAGPWRATVALSTLRAGGAAVSVTADPSARTAVAAAFELTSLDALSIDGTFSPMGSDGWRFDGTLRAQGAQTCVVTLDPAPFSIEEPVSRRWSASAKPLDPLAEIAYDTRALHDRALDGGSDEDDALDPDLEDEEIEPLVDPIDIGAAAAEALSLALPPYPRAPEAALDAAQAAPPGETPLSDDDVKPFAGLKALLDQKDEPQS